jgi:DNA modification methylase
VADQSVQCCVTSPPYFGLRDYGHAGQMGLEQTPEAYVAELVGLFREVRRVLKDDGTVWLNLGDSYASNPASGGPGKQWENNNKYKRPSGLKPKDLIGIPWRVAFALQADGWYLRQDIIWHKPNPMPESVRDRCTKAHEYLFLLSKSERYFWDAEAMQEASVQPASKHNKGGAIGTRGVQGYANASGAQRDNSGGSGTNGQRNRRSVWTIPTRPYRGAHFATFPPELVEPCILAGSRPGDTILDPFGGSGTTGMVAAQHGRNAILCELNAAYADLIHERLSGLQVGLPLEAA